jgi:LCP family protein required for cell wall assembly
MRRLTRRRKEDILRLSLSAVICLCLCFSAVMIHRLRKREAVPAFSLIPKTDKTVLVLGKDDVGQNTDVIFLVRLNGREETATLLQLPRDTYVEQGGKGRKLNSLYGRLLAAHKGDKSPEKKALAELTDLLSQSLGIRIDDYLLTDLSLFRKTVDALGGVTMTVPYDLHYEDPEQDLFIHLDKGTHTLNGEKAEQFIRFRSGYLRADLGRIDAQKLFLAALMVRIKEGLTVKQLFSVGEGVLTHAVTSLTVTELPSLLSAALSLPLSGLSMATAPGTVTPDGRYYVLNRAGVTALLSKTFPPSGGAFDPNRLFCGTGSEEIAFLYQKPYEGDPLVNAETLTEEGISIAIRGS